MNTIFAAQCGGQEQAENVLEPLAQLVWTSPDEQFQSTVETELRQDAEGHWWGCVSVSGLAWEPINAAEANYRFLLSYGLARWIRAHVLRGPAFQSAFWGEITSDKLDALLAGQEHEAASAERLIGAGGAPFRLPLFVQTSGVGWIVSEAFWDALGSPAIFEPVAPGYLERNQPGRQLSEGIEPPPLKVITGQMMRVVVDPDQSEALRRRAEDLIETGEFGAAIDLLARAQRLNPLSPDIHFDLAVARRFHGQYTEALEGLSVFDMLNVPDSLLLLVHQLRGDILRLQGNAEEALAAYEASLRLHPQPRYAMHPLRQRAELLAMLSLTIEAKSACEDALRISPEDTDMLALRSQLQGQLTSGAVRLVRWKLNNSEWPRRSSPTSPTSGRIEA